MTIPQGIYASTTLRIDLLGIARDEAGEEVAVYREIDEQRRLRVMAVERFREGFKVVMSNAEGLK